MAKIRILSYIREGTTKLAITMTVKITRDKPGESVATPGDFLYKKRGLVRPSPWRINPPTTVKLRSRFDDRRSDVRSVFFARELNQTYSSVRKRACFFERPSDTDNIEDPSVSASTELTAPVFSPNIGTHDLQEAEPVRYCLYARKSSEAEE